ncbi:MFS transporter [Salinibacterium sp. GXW1014]|uniref:MFS transporter n=1 Tax=Salinibacterium sp. GXW1014 TaxID=3377838 RepID=UPI00383B91BA
MTTTPNEFRWGAILLPALLPAALFATGAGAIVPIIPILASRLAEDLLHEPSSVLAVASIVTALLMIGELVGNIPSGWLVSRLGERNSMIGASLLAMAGLLACIVAENIFILGVGVLLIGLATAVFGLARHALITTYVPPSHRARALSTVGGLFRLGYFIGPFITVGVLALFTNLQAAFWTHVVMCIACIVVLVVAPDPARVLEAQTARFEDADGAELARPTRGLFATIVASRGVLLRLGTAGAILNALRAGRIVVFPLWAVSLGLDEVTTAVLIGVSGAVDFALFYLGGWIIDRFGRAWNAVPSTLLLSAGFITLAITHQHADAIVWFLWLAMLISVANGFSTGILLTLGSDLADPRDPAPFLGAWRFTGGLGNAIAPLAIALATATISLSAGVLLLGSSGLLGAALFTRFIPRYVAGEGDWRLRRLRRPRD